ncbi:putative entry exclusion protein TrbK-alt [Xanthobacter sp. AM11]|uniref:putative entry exclusion protein TrbK-alt n=1 Tax=Xanthobacter sp. AM11 TaxID=3380643 RepID=UPI0039BF5E42
MDGKMFARLGAVVFVGVAITATVIEMTPKEEEPEVRTLVLRPGIDATALQRQLRGCRDMGEAAIRDPACLKLWAANRDRFLGQNPEAPQTAAPTAPAAPTPTATIAPAPAPDAIVKETAPVMQAEPARPGSH